jgi:hypothetical protein
MKPITLSLFLLLAAPVLAVPADTPTSETVTLTAAQIATNRLLAEAVPRVNFHRVSLRGFLRTVREHTALEFVNFDHPRVFDGVVSIEMQDTTAGEVLARALGQGRLEYRIEPDGKLLLVEQERQSLEFGGDDPDVGFAYSVEFLRARGKALATLSPDTADYVQWYEEHIANVRALYASPVMEGQEPPEGMVPPAPSAVAYTAVREEEKAAVLRREEKERFATEMNQRQWESELKAKEIMVRALEASRPQVIQVNTTTIVNEQ